MQGEKLHATFQSHKSAWNDAEIMPATVVTIITGASGSLVCCIN